MFLGFFSYNFHIRLNAKTMKTIEQFYRYRYRSLSIDISLRETKNDTKYRFVTILSRNGILSAEYEQVNLIVESRLLK